METLVPYIERLIKPEESKEKNQGRLLFVSNSCRDYSLPSDKRDHQDIFSLMCHIGYKLAEDYTWDRTILEVSDTLYRSSKGWEEPIKGIIANPLLAFGKGKDPSMPEEYYSCTPDIENHSYLLLRFAEEHKIPIIFCTDYDVFSPKFISLTKIMGHAGFALTEGDCYRGVVGMNNKKEDRLWIDHPFGIKNWPEAYRRLMGAIDLEAHSKYVRALSNLGIDAEDLCEYYADDSKISLLEKISKSARQLPR